VSEWYSIFFSDEVKIETFTRGITATPGSMKNWGTNHSTLWYGKFCQQNVFWGQYLYGPVNQQSCLANYWATNGASEPAAKKSTPVDTPVLLGSAWMRCYLTGWSKLSNFPNATEVARKKSWILITETGKSPETFVSYVIYTASQPCGSESSTFPYPH